MMSGGCVRVPGPISEMGAMDAKMKKREVSIQDMLGYSLERTESIMKELDFLAQAISPVCIPDIQPGNAMKGAESQWPDNHLIRRVDSINERLSYISDRISAITKSVAL